VLNSNYKGSLSEKLFGFRDNISFQDAISYCSKLIYKSLDKDMLEYIFNIAKAFDSILYDTLLIKLKTIINCITFWLLVQRILNINNML